jgi:hypothetical protein
MARTNHFLFSFVLFTAITSSLCAQDCPEDPVTKKGVWKNYPDDGLAGFIVHPVTMKHKAQIGQMLDTIANLFIKYNPAPIGSEARWKKSLRTEWDSITSPDPSFSNYMYTGAYFPYICSNGTVKAFSQTDTWVYVHVNGYWPSGHMYQHEFNKTLGEKLFTLAPQRGTLGGYPVFEPIPKGEEDSPWLLFYSVLIHHPGKLPYVPVTKREFFELSRRLIEVREKKIKYDADIKNATPEKIKAHGEEWYLEQMDRVDKQFKGIYNNLALLEKLYEKELNQPAILRSWEYTMRDIEIADPTQKKFFTTANRGYQLVRANPDYMDQKQEKWKPQFIWVEWYKPVAMKNAIELDKVLREKFDFKELCNLLTR